MDTDGDRRTGDGVTELGLARDFVRHFAVKLVAAVEAGAYLDDRIEFREYCGRFGLEATAQRLDLVTDVAVVLGEHYRSRDTGWESPEDLDGIPGLAMAEGLERYGWRRGFLDKPVEG